MSVCILYEDSQILVCVKPQGLPVQTRAVGRRDLENELKNYLAAAGKEPWIGVVHRLDQPVEGVMVFARTQGAAAGLSAQAAGTSMEKTYYTVVYGRPEQPAGVLTDYLVRDGRKNRSRVSSKDAPGAKKAILRYRLMDCRKGRSLLEIKLLTGRHHQIRVQLASMGTPIVGDRKYHIAEEKEYRGLALCACRLKFLHPSTGKEMSFECRPSGEEFKIFGLS